MKQKGGKHLIKKEPQKKFGMEKKRAPEKNWKKPAVEEVCEDEAADYIEETQLPAQAAAVTAEESFAVADEKPAQPCVEERAEAEPPAAAPMKAKKGKKAQKAPKIQKEKKERGEAKRIRIPKAVVALAVIVLVIAVIGGGIYSFVDSKLDKISYGADENTPMKTGAEFAAVGDRSEFDGAGLEQKESGGALPTDDVFADENVINILLLGTDMKIPGTEDPGRCDLTMICSLNKSTGDVKLVGFERTIGVPVPKYEDEMLSYVFQYGGGEFMQETINKCFLVDIAGYVHVSYEMFPKVIDAIGGIEVELDNSEIYYMSQYLAYDPAKDTLHEGLCHLNGTAAYSFCRLRDPDDDWGRQERVREAVAAMFSKLKDMSLKDINNMANEVLPMISTNLTKAEIKSLMGMAPKFINAEISQLMIPEKEGSWTYVTGRGAHMLGCDFEACAKEIKQFLYE